ncbi:unnamed protein product [Meganyctiphanes norvegica]|uniref:Metalloendopeptidase n=1 Tax=Meganyctiphanes norvegica TaxID=48144 RepID=A0AAV2PNV1_MEGNR
MAMQLLILLPLLICALSPGLGKSIQFQDAETYNWMDNNPEWTESGKKIVDGDIALEDDDPRPTSRKMVPDPEKRWPDDPLTGWPLVPYNLQNYPKADHDVIHEGLDHWMENTCLVFQETYILDQPHINFNEGNGCHSNIGRVASHNGQVVSIGQGCKQMHTVAHEVGHAIGFHHEQCRTDRDDYITVLYENIKPGSGGNFNKHEDNSTGVEYDYSSIMHYGSQSFSENGLNTIMPKFDPTMQRFMGHHTGLTFRDKLLANRVYDCIGKWKKVCGANSMECSNLGYMGADCKCVCPPGTSGKHCQHVEGGYYPALTCGGNMTAPGYIETSNWPDIPNPNEWCMWWVQAGDGERVRVTFHAFDLTYRPDSGRCIHDKLELRLQDPLTTGNKYCEDEIKPDDEFVSEGSEMFISFFGATHQNNHTGFSATIDFIS